MVHAFENIISRESGSRATPSLGNTAMLPHQNSNYKALRVEGIHHPSSSEGSHGVSPLSAVNHKEKARESVALQLETSI
jgi:hypothetical protein